jgi:hypothetical protein
MRKYIIIFLVFAFLALAFSQVDTTITERRPVVRIPWNELTPLQKKVAKFHPTIMQKVMPIDSLPRLLRVKINAPATTGTMTIPVRFDIINITPTGACTFNAGPGGKVGDMCSFHITTSGTTSRILTWGTGFYKTGTLSTGTTSGRFFTVTFQFDGIMWWEMCRTAAQQ